MLARPQVSEENNIFFEKTINERETVCSAEFAFLWKLDEEYFSYDGQSFTFPSTFSTLQIYFVKNLCLLEYRQNFPEFLFTMLMKKLQIHCVLPDSICFYFCIQRSACTLPKERHLPSTKASKPTESANSASLM